MRGATTVRRAAGAHAPLGRPSLSPAANFPNFARFSARSRGWAHWEPALLHGLRLSRPSLGDAQRAAPGGLLGVTGVGRSRHAAGRHPGGLCRTEVSGGRAFPRLHRQGCGVTRHAPSSHPHTLIPLLLPAGRCPSASAPSSGYRSASPTNPRTCPSSGVPSSRARRRRSRRSGWRGGRRPGRQYGPARPSGRG